MNINNNKFFFLTLVIPLAWLDQGWAEEANNTDYQAARWDPIHFEPAIDSATDKQCLSCHQEILERRVLPQSPAGVAASESLAWYQTLSTYQGEQETFHRRHLVTPLATGRNPHRLHPAQGGQPQHLSDVSWGESLSVDGSAQTLV